MAYNLYDVGITGKEITRRLKLLDGVSFSDDDRIATTHFVENNYVSNNTINTINDQISGINQSTLDNTNDINTINDQISGINQSVINLAGSVSNMQLNKADKTIQTDVTSNTSTYIQTNSGKLDFELQTYKYGILSYGSVTVESKNLFKEANYAYHFNYDNGMSTQVSYKPGQKYELIDPSTNDKLVIDIDINGVITINGKYNYDDVYINIASGVILPFINTYYTISAFDT